MVSVDLESSLVFTIVTTTQRLDLVVWSMNRKHAILLELTVLWEQSILDDESRKETKNKELVKACTEKSWGTEFHHIVVGC